MNFIRSTLLIVLLAIAPMEAAAASCSAKAATIAASRGGTVLSVSSAGSMCVIKILVKSAAGAPKRITVRVQK